MKTLPRLEISLSKIFENTKMLVDLYGKKNISVMGVTKVVLGNALIAQVMCNGGIDYIADSRMDNILKMKEAGITSKFVLLRTMKSEAHTIVENIDISFNTEIETLAELSYHAEKQKKIHQVIIMIEIGDLREGVMPDDILCFIEKAKNLKHVQIIGIGCNLACFGGVKPDQKNMDQLSQISTIIEEKCSVPMMIVTGGNSSNYNWFQFNHNLGKINNLRLGESIFLGLEPLYRKKIFGLHTDAFRLFGEVIESKQKPSFPIGDLAQNGFGENVLFLERGIGNRVIVALGRQDVDVSNLRLLSKLDILGSSSDHLIIDPLDQVFKIGDEIEFELNYSALLTAMTSPFVRKVFT